MIIILKDVYGLRNIKNSMKNVQCYISEHFSVPFIHKLIVWYMFLVDMMEIKMWVFVKNIPYMKTFGEAFLQWTYLETELLVYWWSITKVFLFLVEITSMMEAWIVLRNMRSSLIDGRLLMYNYLYQCMIFLLYH